MLMRSKNRNCKIWQLCQLASLTRALDRFDSRKLQWYKFKPGDALSRDPPAYI